MAELTTNKVIALVLVVLVIAVVLIFIFKPDILSYIKNLPEYKYEYEKDKETTGEEELAKEKLACPENNPVIVGFIAIKEAGWYIYQPGTSESTKLYLDKEKTEIKLDVSGLDKNLGVVKSKKIIFNSEWLSGENFFEYRTKDILPSREFLLNLDNANIVSRKNYPYSLICREKEITFQDIPEIDSKDIVFEFQDGKMNYNLEYIYDENGWKVETTRLRYKKVEEQIKYLDFVGPRSQIYPKQKRENDYYFIKSLIGKDYDEGLLLFVKRVLDNKGTGLKIYLRGIEISYNNENKDKLSSLLREMGIKSFPVFSGGAR